MFTVQIISLNIRDRLFGRIMQMTIINYSPPRQDAQLKFALININKQSTTGPRVGIGQTLNKNVNIKQGTDD